jgi:hypothetical protein
MRKVKVLLIGPPALAQLLKYLFRSNSEFEIVGQVGRFRDLSSCTLYAPGLIVANVKPIGTGFGSAIASIKEFSPSSKVILICPVRELRHGARKCGADACLDQEKLVFHLLPTARVVSRSSLRA